MSQKIFDNHLVAIHKSKVTLTLNKPAYIGKYNLEFNKLLMYEFHYDYIKNKYASNSRLLFSDTNSLMYEIKTEDVFEDFSKHKEIFDFSNYSAESKCHNNSNKLVPGKIKDETGGVTSKGLVGLKSKMFFFLVSDSSEHKKGKGLNRNVAVTMPW